MFYISMEDLNLPIVLILFVALCATAAGLLPAKLATHRGRGALIVWGLLNVVATGVIAAFALAHMWVSEWGDGFAGPILLGQLSFNCSLGLTIGALPTRQSRIDRHCNGAVRYIVDCFRVLLVLLVALVLDVAFIAFVLWLVSHTASYWQPVR